MYTILLEKITGAASEQLLIFLKKKSGPPFCPASQFLPRYSFNFFFAFLQLSNLQTIWFQIGMSVSAVEETFYLYGSHPFCLSLPNLISQTIFSLHSLPIWKSSSPQSLSLGIIVDI
jgi:hypothetical protein